MPDTQQETHYTAIVGKIENATTEVERQRYLDELDARWEMVREQIDNDRINAGKNFYFWIFSGISKFRLFYIINK